jgi:hypothetical protein
MLWHAFLFLGLSRPDERIFPPFPLLLGGFHCLFLQAYFEVICRRRLLEAVTAVTLIYHSISDEILK